MIATSDGWLPVRVHIVAGRASSKWERERERETEGGGDGSVVPGF